MAFWWRGWLLILAGAIATILGGYVFSRDFDGAGAGLAVAIYAVLFLGAVSGFIASLLVIIGRIGEWTLLRPVIVLPTVLFLIPATLYGASVINERQRAASLAVPSSQCIQGRHLVLIGKDDFALPVAPGIVVKETGIDGKSYSLGLNQGARVFCAEAARRSPLPVDSVSLDFGRWPTMSAVRNAVCVDKDTGYPYARESCSPASVRDFPDFPMNVTLRLAVPDAPALEAERTRIVTLPFETTPEGIRVRTERNFVYLGEDGDSFAKCRHETSPSGPLLHCTANKRISDSVFVSYSFKATEANFRRVSQSSEKRVDEVLAYLRVQR